ncbi:hypothetical protein UA08_01251 [Talaromyces atroroseus]|uniref:F-box domain-containing protein n=1 Tax=Talaromyces atroroseus TaxID=1441469 RepID=A0A1Q5QB02_TALAT|nr:hypothetical protein UA08_01251 [Talaromyces atroroseus]OKL63123.1 hypothetical protein UA08_01251 [Talaromyces atroroseus]
MPSLLNIPPELRECIIQHVLCSHQMPPETPSNANRVDFEDMDIIWRESPYGIYHEQRGTHSPSNCISLLLTNRQLSAETRSVINRMRSTTTYVLDISVLNELELFPTWVSVPHITNRVSKLYVDVRFFGHILSEKVARYQYNDEDVLGYHWSFYGLLARFLRYGPVDEKKKMSGRQNSSSKKPTTFHDYDVTVNLLVLNFKSAETELSFPPDTVTYQTWRSHHFTPIESRDISPASIDLEKYTTRPEWFSTFLFHEIKSFLSMSYLGSFYGRILYERIGAIRILVNENLEHEFDLSSMLASLRFTGPWETFGHIENEDRLSAFWNWKRQTLMRRDQLGFPVVRAEDLELA